MCLVTASPGPRKENNLLIKQDNTQQHAGNVEIKKVVVVVLMPVDRS